MRCPPWSAPKTSSCYSPALLGKAPVSGLLFPWGEVGGRAADHSGCGVGVGGVGPCGAGVLTGPALDSGDGHPWRGKFRFMVRRRRSRLVLVTLWVHMRMYACVCMQACMWAGVFVRATYAVYQSCFPLVPPAIRCFCFVVFVCWGGQGPPSETTKHTLVDPICVDLVGVGGVLTHVST